MAFYLEKYLQFAYEVVSRTMSYCELGYLKLDRAGTQVWMGVGIPQAMN